MQASLSICGAFCPFLCSGVHCYQHEYLCNWVCMSTWAYIYELTFHSAHSPSWPSLTTILFWANIPASQCFASCCGVLSGSLGKANSRQNVEDVYAASTQSHCKFISAIFWLTFGFVLPIFFPKVLHEGLFYVRIFTNVITWAIS